ncbi:PAAR domain-containing protein, partial [Xanthomonas oryzae pv. oryzae]
MRAHHFVEADDSSTFNDLGIV